MKFFKYYVCMAFSFCSCTEAAPKEKIPELTCPYVLPAAKDFPSSWVILGQLNDNKLQLRETGIVRGDASGIKQTVLETKERVFAEDIIDEWEEFKDRSEATAEYSESHQNMSMMCTYSKNQKEYTDPNLNVVLLIPLPVKKPVTCLLVRRDVDPTHEISCKVK